MLLVTAVLTTSVALGSVTGVSIAHEIPTLHSFASVLAGAPASSVLTSLTGVASSAGALPTGLSVPDAPPVPFIGPVADPNQLVHGSRFLQQVSLQPVDKVATYLKSHAADVAALLAKPLAPSEVTSWWSALDGPMRDALRSANPSLVGNLDGIPYSTRDMANRALLGTTMKQLEATIADESGRTVVENAKVQLRMLQSIADALGSQPAASAQATQPAGSEPASGPASSVPAAFAQASAGGPQRTLLTLDVTGQGKAAIVIGDLNTATYVSYLVPGMFFTIENQMGDWTDAASNLYDEELSWLSLLDPDAASKSVATVAWIGYHTPNLTNVGGIENADEGRDALASAIEGLQSIRKGDEPYTSIIAHSYGSTAALMALTEYDFQVDALAMVGSPGSPAKSVAELHVRPGHVWVGEAAWDPIPNSSYFGSDPGSKSYGANSMGVGGGTDSLTQKVLQASLGHNEYFSAGTESMRNFALIAINQGELVSAAPGH